MPADIPAQVRVLAVDDEEANLAVLSAILRPEGCKVMTARSGQECLEMVAQSAPDIVLMDVQMPGMNGYEATSALRSDPAAAAIPVVLVTGLTTAEDRARGLRAGAVDFLTKPVDPAELSGKVASLARLKRYNDEMKRRTDELSQQLARQVAGAGSELKSALEAFARFVPQEFLAVLGKSSVLGVNLGDNVKREIAILFSDIRSFTTLSEKMSPEENFRFLNAYLGRMNPYVWENGGFIDKYMGDAIMAIFPQGAEPALQAALAMLTHIPVYNEQRARFGYVPIRIGIGVHRGEAMLGVIGHPRFLQGTAISDAVNLSSRLQDLTKIYGVALVISSQVLSDLHDPNRYDYRFLDKLTVRGKAEAVSVYEVFDADPADQREYKRSTRSEFEKAVYDFHTGRFSQALQRFDALRREGDPDATIEIYRSRCSRALKVGSFDDLAV
ncbi:MAG TPA: response regulator [Spirochaetia bacterium]|nr:response regulator [Spirochaetia bacterium]